MSVLKVYCSECVMVSICEPMTVLCKGMCV
jgi:hypothetical protein